MDRERSSSDGMSNDATDEPRTRHPRWDGRGVIDDPSLAELEADVAATQTSLVVALDLERQQWDNLAEARALVASALYKAQEASLRYRTLRANARRT